MNTLKRKNVSLSDRRSWLVDEIYRTIFELLVSRKIAPGARITVDQLARELDVSHTPIREALTRLEETRLVVKTPLIGYSATLPLTRQQFEDIYELRLLLEPHAAAVVAQAGNKHALASLEKIAQKISNASSVAKSISSSRFAELDASFHETIARSAGNEYVSDALERLHVHSHLFRLGFKSQLIEASNQEHARVMEAIVRGDSVGASKTMIEHIELSKSRYLQDFWAIVSE